MSVNVSLARPYAKAVFEMAQSQNTISDWQKTLSLLSAVAADENTIALLKDPRVTPEKRAEFFTAVLGDQVSAAGKTFIKILADNKRLRALPTMFELFNHLVAESEQKMEVKVISAQKVDDAHLKRLSGALEKKFGHKVAIECEEDSSLLAGAKIQMGDRVIDGSALGRLKGLIETLRT